MSRFQVFFTVVAFIIFITLTVNIIEVGSTTTDVGGNMITNLTFSFDTLNGVLKTFVNILTFNIQGLPPLVSTFISLIFLPLNLLTLYMIVDLIANAL